MRNSPVDVRECVWLGVGGWGPWMFLNLGSARRKQRSILPLSLMDLTLCYYTVLCSIKILIEVKLK